jgi:hypothetical protein
LLPNRLYDLYRIEKSERLETEMELPVRMAGNSNGAGLTLDTGSLAIGVKMTGNDWDYLTGRLERIRADMGAVPLDHAHTEAFLRAIVLCLVSILVVIGDYRSLRGFDNAVASITFAMSAFLPR